jgi:hypothetical protein
LELARPFGGEECGNTEKLVAELLSCWWKEVDFFVTRFFVFLRYEDGFRFITAVAGLI